MDLRPWEAEIEADEDLARRLIDSQFEDLAPATLEAFAVGWDNTAWLGNLGWRGRFGYLDGGARTLHKRGCAGNSSYSGHDHEQ